MPVDEKQKYRTPGYINSVTPKLKIMLKEVEQIEFTVTSYSRECHMDIIKITGAATVEIMLGQLCGPMIVASVEFKEGDKDVYENVDTVFRRCLDNETERLKQTLLSGLSKDLNE